MARHEMCTAKHWSGDSGKGNGKEGRYALRSISTWAFCEGQGERDDLPMGIARCGLLGVFSTHSWEARRDTLRYVLSFVLFGSACNFLYNLDSILCL